MSIIKTFLFIVCRMQLLYATQSIDVGLYDGGEYCYRIPGSHFRGMYPDAKQMQQCLDRSCDVGQIAVLEPLDTNYWNNRAMDFEELRSFFPILQQSVNNHPLIYFDSASTAQMPQIVLDAMVDYYQTYKSNVGRGLYDSAEKATHMFETSRAKIARFIGAKKDEIVFTSGTTAGINLVGHMWAEHHIQAGDEIVISEVEHNANFIPWQQLAKRKGAVLKIVPLNEHGVIDVHVLQNYLSSKTKLVAITHLSNILGVVNDIKSIAQVAHAVGAKILIDAAQSIVHQKIDVVDLDCDFLVFSGHKLFGPTGVGVLFLKEYLCAQCVLENFGGGAVLSVTLENTEFKPFPYGLEPGTQAIAQVIGLGAAIDFMQKYINFEQVAQHETKLVRYLVHELQQIPGVTLISPMPDKNQCSNLVTFCVEQCHAYDVASYLNEFGIAVRAGYHCVQPYHDKLGGSASVRVSLSVYNTQQEVEFFVQCLQKYLLTFK